MPTRNYTKKDGSSIKPVPKDANVRGMDLPDEVAPPISDSTVKAIRTLMPNAPSKLPRKGWGGK